MSDQPTERVHFLYFSERGAEDWGSVFYKILGSDNLVEVTEASEHELNLPEDRPGWKDLVFVGKGSYYSQGRKGFHKVQKELYGTLDILNY